jgi:hypothetical protein
MIDYLLNTSSSVEFLPDKPLWGQIAARSIFISTASARPDGHDADGGLVLIV